MFLELFQEQMASRQHLVQLFRVAEIRELTTQARKQRAELAFLELLIQVQAELEVQIHQALVLQVDQDHHPQYQVLLLLIVVEVVEVVGRYLQMVALLELVAVVREVPLPMETVQLELQTRVVEAVVDLPQLQELEMAELE